MDRRAFLKDAARMLVVLPFGTFLLQCGDDDDDETPFVTLDPTQPDTSPPDAPPRVEGANIVYTSSEDNAHSHSFTIPSSALESPPPAGLVGDTTSAQFHTHTVTVTQGTLEGARNGQAVKVQTSEDLGHRHTFTFVRVS